MNQHFLQVTSVRDLFDLSLKRPRHHLLSAYGGFFHIAYLVILVNKMPENSGVELWKDAASSGTGFQPTGRRRSEVGIHAQCTGQSSLNLTGASMSTQAS